MQVNYYRKGSSIIEELLIKDNSFTIYHQNLQRHATEMFKVRNNLSPKSLREIFPFSKNYYSLRKDNPFQTKIVHNVMYGTETASFRGLKTWALLPEHIRNSPNIDVFKARIKLWKPIGCCCKICKIYIPQLGFI